MAPLFFLLTLLPFLELFLLIRLGRLVGAPSVIAYVIAVGFVGASLARGQGRRVIVEWQRALAEGRVPAEGVLGGVLVLAGGVLLILPGVISDVIGLLCLIPPTRRRIAAGLARRVQQRIHVQAPRPFEWPRGVRGSHPGAPPPPVRGDVIDTEGEDVTDRD